MMGLGLCLRLGLGRWAVLGLCKSRPGINTGGGVAPPRPHPRLAALHCREHGT